MRLIDLLHKLSFDNITPYVIQYDGEKNSLAAYKVHYDILCSLTPVYDNSSESKAYITYYKEDDNVEEKVHYMLDAYPLEGASWEEVVGYELELSPEVIASEEEIAACCLWHTSYFGFTKEQRRLFFEELGNTVSGDGLFKRFIDIYHSNLPSKKELMCIPTIHNQIHTEMKLHRHYKSNRKDKITKFLYQKRSWRKWKRYEINRMFKKRIKEIGQFLCTIPNPTEKASTLFRVNCYFISGYRTYTDDATKRFDYLYELIEKYNAFHDLPYSHCILCVSCSKDFPVSPKEKELISLITQNLKGKSEVVYYQDDSLREDLRIDLFNYE